MSGVVLDAEYLARRADVARANAWIAHMAAYKTEVREAWGGQTERSEADEAREAYVSGEITLEAFEGRLNILFGIKR